MNAERMQSIVVEVLTKGELKDGVTKQGKFNEIHQGVNASHPMQEGTLKTNRSEEKDHEPNRSPCNGYSYWVNYTQHIPYHF